jgi:hypothetical protein
MELWMHGISSEDPQGCLERLSELGFSAVVLGGNKEQLAAAKSLGMGAYACTGTFGRSKDFQDERYLAVDVEGTPREWFGSTCPNEKGVRQLNLSSIEKIMSETDADGLLLDGCRFASPASGMDAFFTCFCPRCRGRAMEMGYDFDRMKKHAKMVYRALADGRVGKRAPDMTPFSLVSLASAFPGLADWMSFRASCIIEHWTDVSELVRGMGGKMGGYIFTPCLSGLVGQRYPGLVKLLDIASPMIYRNYPDDPGPACINKEAAMLARFIQRGGPEGEEAAEAVNTFLGLAESGRSIEEIDEGVTPRSVDLELERTAEMLSGGPQLVPILYLADEQVEGSMKTADDLALDGVNFFVYKDEWRDIVERVSQYGRGEE